MRINKALAAGILTLINQESSTVALNFVKRGAMGQPDTVVVVHLPPGVSVTITDSVPVADIRKSQTALASIASRNIQIVDTWS